MDQRVVRVVAVLDRRGALDRERPRTEGVVVVEPDGDIGRPGMAQRVSRSRAPSRS
jgi:hypothetical protein